MTVFSWTDAFLLGYPPMDATHREFVACVQALLDADEATVLGALIAFQSHAERHFAEEREWMESTAFPARECHVDEHEAVLKSLREVRAHLEAGGDPHVVRGLAQELVRWFPGHADYMDAALSHWMVKRRMGGKPVVLKRNILAEG